MDCVTLCVSHFPHLLPVLIHSGEILKEAQLLRVGVTGFGDKASKFCIFLSNMWRVAWHFCVRRMKEGEAQRKAEVRVI